MYKAQQDWLVDRLINDWVDGAIDRSGRFISDRQLTDGINDVCHGLCVGAVELCCEVQLVVVFHSEGPASVSTVVVM